MSFINDWQPASTPPPNGTLVEVAMSMDEPSGPRKLKMLYADGAWWRKKGKFLFGIFPELWPVRWRYLPKPKKRKPKAR